MSLYIYASISVRQMHRIEIEDFFSRKKESAKSKEMTGVIF